MNVFIYLLLVGVHNIIDRRSLFELIKKVKSVLFIYIKAYKQTPADEDDSSPPLSPEKQKKSPKKAAYKPREPPKIVDEQPTYNMGGGGGRKPQFRDNVQSVRMVYINII